MPARFGSNKPPLNLPPHERLAKAERRVNRLRRGWMGSGTRVHRAPVFGADVLAPQVSLARRT